MLYAISTRREACTPNPDVVPGCRSPLVFHGCSARSARLSRHLAVVSSYLMLLRQLSRGYREIIALHFDYGGI